MKHVGTFVLNLDSAKQIGSLLEQGVFGFGVFECEDVFKTYEELRARCVVYVRKPSLQFSRYEILFRDDSNNWFSIVQKKGEAAF